MAGQIQSKYGFKGELKEKLVIDGVSFREGLELEFGPYDTSSRRDQMQKQVEQLFVKIEQTVILTCSSVGAFAEVQAAQVQAQKQAEQKQAVAQQPKQEQPKPAARSRRTPAQKK